MVKKVITVDGSASRDINLADEVFAAEVSEGSIYHALRNELANRRAGTASTKTRAQVKGSNAKPWRQKGTGRARAGHKRSPLWAHGGVIFGPHPRDYGYRLPRKVKRLAMRSLLSQKALADRLLVMEDFTVQSGKTRDLLAILKKVNPQEQGRTVIVLGKEDPILRRAGRNLPSLSFLAYNRLSAHKLFYASRLILLEQAAVGLNEFYAEKNKQEVS
jgi:large subunit ribosomal protein L4